MSGTPPEAKLTPADPQVGQRLPKWTRTTDLQSWNRFAAVNDEFLLFHMDDEAGRAAGNPRGAFGMGNLRFAYLHNAVRAAFGDGATVEELSCQFRAVNQKGEVLTVVGTVTEVQADGCDVLVSLDLDVLNDGGRSTCPGAAKVRVTIDPGGRPSPPR